MNHNKYSAIQFDPRAHAKQDGMVRQAYLLALLAAMVFAVSMVFSLGANLEQTKMGLTDAIDINQALQSQGLELGN